MHFCKVQFYYIHIMVTWTEEVMKKVNKMNSYTQNLEETAEIVRKEGLERLILTGYIKGKRDS